MGLRLSVYKDRGQSYSNGGFSEKFDAVTVMNVEGPSEPSEDAPPVMLVANAMGTARIVPAVETPDGGFVPASYGDLYDGKGVGPMMGGTYVGTSDSRFSKAVEEIVGGTFYGAVPFHDRFEDAALYASMST